MAIIRPIDNPEPPPPVAMQRIERTRRLVIETPFSGEYEFTAERESMPVDAEGKQAGDPKPLPSVTRRFADISGDEREITLPNGKTAIVKLALLALSIPEFIDWYAQLDEEHRAAVAAEARRVAEEAKRLADEFAAHLAEIQEREAKRAAARLSPPDPNARIEGAGEEVSAEVTDDAPTPLAQDDVAAEDRGGV